MPIPRLVLLLAAVFAAAVPAPFAAAGDAPAVTGVEVTSDAGADATYARGETIRVTVRFSEAVNVTGAPGLAIDMDPASWGEKRAVYASGSGTAALVFAHEVVEPNYSTRGVAVLADTLALRGGSIRSASSGADAALAHAGLPHDAAHRVDWRPATDSGAPPDTVQGDTTPPDTTAPRLLRGEIDGATMRLVFSEALDEAATGGSFWVTVQTAKTASRHFHARGEVTIDGALVTVGLGAGNPRAQAGLLERNRVRYLRRADTVGALRDLAGNPVSTPQLMLIGRGWRSSESIDLVNVTGAAPVATGVEVTGVAVTSEPRADATYALGETIEVTVRFSEAVEVTGTPRLKVDMDPAAGGETWASYDRGSGGSSLTFVHTVAEPNISTQGIAVLANTLETGGGTIRAGGAAANLAHDGLAHDTNHKVDWQRAVELPPLTARFVDVPASHGGEDSAFSFGLVFSETLVRQLSSATLRNEALSATNATVIRTKRVVKGDNRRWTVTVRPDSGADVTVSLPATADCAAAGALCTPDGRRLSNAVTATVAGQPLTARFVDVPASHGGEDSAFSFGLVFSEALVRQLSSATLRNVALRATNAAVIRTKRVVKRDNRRWTVTVRPDPGAEVTVSLPATTDCAAAGALCTPDGRPLSNAVTATISNVATVSQAAPSVTGVEVTSDAGADATYALGETVRVAVTFGEAVNVTGTPRLKLGLGSGAERWADYASGSGTAMLAFAWTVAQGDASGAGVAVLANTLALNGGAIRSRVSGKAAALAHAGLPHDTNHKVDGTLPDTTPPRLSRTVVDGTTMRLAFNEAIDNAASLTNGDFTVKKTPPGGTEETVGLRGTPAVAGAAVTLTLAQAVRGADRGVKVSYRKSDSDARNRLRDEAGNEVADFSDEPVANSADTTPPELVGGEIDGGTVTLWFSEALDPDSVGGCFRVHVYKATGGSKEYCATGDVEISGNVVTVGLGQGEIWATAGVPSESWRSNLFMYYAPADPAAKRLRDLAGNPVQTPIASYTSEWRRTHVIDLDNLTPDTTPPELVRGEIDGGTMTLWFSEPLDPDATAGRFKLQVRYALNALTTFYAAGEVAVDGNRVTVGLGAGKPRAIAGGRHNYFHGYSRPTDPAARGLRDLAGNEVWDTRGTDLDNATGAPSVTRVALSSNAGADRTYAQGETIRMTLTFNEAVTVTGAPRVKLGLGSGAGDERWAAYASGSGTKVLEFAYTVAEGDASTAGVAVLANTLTLNGGTIRSVSAADENATLAHAGLGHDPAHKVDTAPPTLSAAFVNGETLTLTFDKALGGASSLTNGAFTVRKTPQGGTEQTVSLSWLPAIAGTVVTLSLANAVLETDTGVKVSYTRPTSGTGNRLRDEVGNEVESFSDRPVTYRDLTPPVLSTAFVNGETLTLTFDEALGAAASLANGAFTVKKTPQGGVGQTVSLSGTPAITGATVTLTLANAVPETDTGVKVSYTRPTSGTGNRLRDATGNEVASFADKPVTNRTGIDIAPPVLSAARVNGATLALTFNEPLGAAVWLANDPFTVKKTPQGGTEQDVSLKGTPAIVDSTVILMLANAVLETDADVKVSYTKPTSGTGNRLRDQAGNEAASFSGEPVPIVSEDITPRLVRGEIDGGTVTLWFSKALDPDSVGGCFRVHVYKATGGSKEYCATGDVEISGNVVTVGLGQGEIWATAGVPSESWRSNRIKYLAPADPAAKRLRDLAGNPVQTLVSFTSEWRRTHIISLDNLTGVARLSVADARANEGAGASAAFEVSLSRAAAGAVTVDYATADGTAEAGADYTATSGTLTFAAGETVKTVSVPVLDDAVDEGEETFTLAAVQRDGRAYRRRRGHRDHRQ